MKNSRLNGVVRIAWESISWFYQEQGGLLQFPDFPFKKLLKWENCKSAFPYGSLFGNNIETLCYFIGPKEFSHENNDEIQQIDGILFPKQKGTSSYVTDNGK